ncbi:MAG: zinc metallopeptidase [Bacteroidia bacterium]
MGYIVLLVLITLASAGVSWRFKKKFKQYSKEPLLAGVTGAEVAKRMLHDSGIYDVEVLSVGGSLSDHYNPMKKTVNLSPDVYNGRSIAAAAVAAHECGHAVQHAKAYSWLYMRSALVPIVSVSNNFVPFLLIAGIIAIAVFQVPWVLMAALVLFAFSTLFSFITLPVEFDASNRALLWLNQTNITSPDEHGQAKDALKWAAMTYVVAALASLATLLYYLSIFLGSRD